MYVESLCLTSPWAFSTPFYSHWWVVGLPPDHVRHFSPRLYYPKMAWWFSRRVFFHVPRTHCHSLFPDSCCLGRGAFIRKASSVIRMWPLPDPGVENGLAPFPGHQKQGSNDHSSLCCLIEPVWEFPWDLNTGAELLCHGIIIMSLYWKLCLCTLSSGHTTFISLTNFVRSSPPLT